MDKQPNKFEEIVVPLPAGFAGRIDAIVGTQNRSEFIRKALELAIEMGEMHKKFDRRNE